MSLVITFWTVANAAIGRADWGNEFSRRATLKNTWVSRTFGELTKAFNSVLSFGEVENELKSKEARQSGTESLRKF